MREYFNHKEFRRWFQQAEHNFHSACRDAEEGDFDWACFKAQQAAELAIKSIIIAFGKISRTHSVYNYRILRI